MLDEGFVLLRWTKNILFEQITFRTNKNSIGEQTIALKMSPLLLF